MQSDKVSGGQVFVNTYRYLTSWAAKDSWPRVLEIRFDFSFMLGEVRIIACGFLLYAGVGVRLCVMF